MHINNVQDGRDSTSQDEFMTWKPKVNLDEALASFDEIYNPRIVTTMNDYDIRIAHTLGDHVWHSHDKTDEFFLVLDGVFDIELRDDSGNESSVHLTKGDVFVVPRGTQHKPSSPGGSILMFEPSGTLTTENADASTVPGHVDATSGHQL